MLFHFIVVFFFTKKNRWLFFSIHYLSISLLSFFFFKFLDVSESANKIYVLLCWLMCVHIFLFYFCWRASTPPPLQPPPKNHHQKPQPHHQPTTNHHNHHIHNQIQGGLPSVFARGARASSLPHNSVRA